MLFVVVSLREKPEFVPAVVKPLSVGGREILAGEL